MLHPELKGENPLALLQLGPPLHLPFEGVHEGPTGAVLGMEYPSVAVGGFQGGAQTVTIPVKGHAQLEQALHAHRGLMHQPLHGRPVAESSAGPQGIDDVAGEAVVGTGDRRDAPLGPATGGSGIGAGVAGRILVLAEQQHPQMLGQFEAGHQARSSATDHHHIPGLLCHGG